MTLSAKKMDHIVVDANAFLKNHPIQDLGENVYTVPEVVSEIRDKATRERLQVLPYELILKEPFPESVQLVTKFAKATGDYTSLSAVDIRLIALTYQITKEKLGVEAAARLLKEEPDNVKVETVLGKGNNLPVKESQNNEKIDSVPEETSNSDTQRATDDDGSKIMEETTQGDEDELENGDKELAESEEDSEDDDDDDESGWITPSNYKQKLKEVEGSVEQDSDADSIPVACLTSDFAMQNVLLHIGLRILSPNGLLIKNLRTYILRCYACYRTTSVMTKVFCPTCGNKTLKKVSVSYKPDGTLVLHLSRRVNITGRGKKFPLPAPKGGKHANNPILVADQPVPQQRPSKMALKKNNPLGVDYIAGSSPFAINDVYSRAGVLGINTKYAGTNYWDKKNPNEARRRTGKKK